MDINSLLCNLQPTAGSKRPSPTSAPGDREVKKSRTQPRDDDTDSNILDNELPLPSSESFYFPSQGLYYYNGIQYDNGSEYCLDNFTGGEIANTSFNLMETGQQTFADTYGPMLYVNEEQLTLYSGATELPYSSQLDLPLAIETWPGNFPLQPLLIDNFPPPSAQFDISMGNISVHDDSTPSRFFEGSLPFMDLGSLGDSQESRSRGHATTPDICSGIDVPLSEQSVVSESKVSEPLSQSPAPSLLAESMEVDSDYDTCFGVVLVAPTSSFSQGIGAHSVPVKLKPFGGILMLYNRVSGAHAGILNNSKLVSTLRHLRLKLEATLFISEVKKIGGISKSKTRKRASAHAAREYSMRIVFYGLQDDKEIVGGLLSDAGCFLQHPSTTEVIPEVQYDNPHYLLRPDAEMPELEDLRLDIVDDSLTMTEPGDEISKSRFLRIFETAGADGGAVAVVNASPSPRLRTPLMKHQIIALAMMHEKETRRVEEPMFPSLWKKELINNSKTMHYRHIVTRSLEPRPTPTMGGILADDMGLGKTLSVLALICSSLDLDSTAMDQSQNAKPRGTLIVAPKSTIYGWMAQAKEHIYEGQIRLKIYHGSGRERVANQLGDFDVVITTYETLRSEWEAQEGTRPLFSWKWLRVILDEAHHIRNRSRKTFRSVCDLVSYYRWCLTGTPIHNSLDDYGALLSFLRVFPFVQKSNFVYWIVRPMEQKHELAVSRLQGLIQATCLRRTKRKTLELPQRSEKIHEVHLHQDDQALYNIYKKLCAEKAAGQEKGSGGSSLVKGRECNILSLIMYLQRICDHGEQLLPSNAKKQWKGEESSSSSLDLEVQHLSGGCSVCGGEIDDRTEDQDSICINCATSEGLCNTNKQADVLSREGTTGSERSGSAEVCYRPSAKVLALLENLRQDANGNTRPRKSVVFSCWVKMLDLVEQAFRQEGIGFQRIDGHTNLEGRQRALQEFNNNPDYTVMLATIGSAAEGVNLTVASMVHLLEPHWNPMVEAQAVDRVHRIGQTQEVTVIRYIVPNSVETYVRNVQEEKMQVINWTMNTNGVTEADLESSRWERMKEMLA